MAPVSQLELPGSPPRTLGTQAQFIGRSHSGNSWEMAGAETVPADPAGSRLPIDKEEPVRKRNPAEVVRMLTDEGIEIVDVRFADLPGMTQHFSVPAHELTEEKFTEGFGFDGSSIRGFQQIQESDMILLPDPDTAVVDPFRQHKTLNINCYVHDPITLEPYSRDPRHIARKAEAYLQSTGIADTAYFGPEAEFFIFDHVEYGQDVNYG